MQVVCCACAVSSIEQSNQVIAVGLKFDLPLLEFKNWVTRRWLREVVDGYVYAVSAKLLIDDFGDDCPVTAGEACAEPGHVD